MNGTHDDDDGETKRRSTMTLLDFAEWADSFEHDNDDPLMD